MAPVPFLVPFTSARDPGTSGRASGGLPPAPQPVAWCGSEGIDLRRPSVSPPVERRASAGVRYGLAVAAVAYVGYLALLVTCDLLRVAPLGVVPRYQRGEVTLAQLQPFSIAHRAGLRPGDRIRQANGQTLERGADWQRVRVHLGPSNPFTLEIQRGEQVFGVDLSLPAGLGEWRSGPPRPGLLAFRLAQIITLGIALMVAFRRSFQPSAARADLQPGFR